LRSDSPLLPSLNGGFCRDLPRARPGGKGIKSDFDSGDLVTPVIQMWNEIIKSGIQKSSIKILLY
jgi:hypothetical protein